MKDQRSCLINAFVSHVSWYYISWEIVTMEFETLGKVTDNLEDVSKPIKAVEVCLFSLDGIHCSMLKFIATKRPCIWSELAESLSHSIDLSCITLWYLQTMVSSQGWGGQFTFTIFCPSPASPWKPFFIFTGQEWMRERSLGVKVKLYRQIFLSILTIFCRNSALFYCKSANLIGSPTVFCLPIDKYCIRGTL